MEDIKETRVDKIFSKLGYVKTENKIAITYYFEGVKNRYIRFTKTGGKDALPKQVKTNNFYITMKDLQAINKKCQELRLVRR